MNLFSSPFHFMGSRLVLSATPSVIVFLVGKSAVTSNTNDVTTAAIDTTGADFLIIFSSDYSAAAARVISDNKGNTWNALTDVSTGASTRGRIYWSKPTSVGVGHTFSNSGTTGFPSIFVAAFKNVNVTPFDVEAFDNDPIGSTTASAGSGVTPTQDNELIIAGVSLGAGDISSINSGFTIVDATVPFGTANNFGGGLAYKIQTTAAVVDPDWTLSTSSSWSAVIASFKKV